MDIELINPADLKPHPNNSRVHPTEQLAALVASFREFGFNGLVVIDEANVILAGHGRTKAALMAELPQIPCRRVTGWTDERKRAYVIADNQIADASTWDEAMLLSELQALQSGPIDLTQFGLDLADLLPPPAPPADAETLKRAEETAGAGEGDDDEDADAAFEREMAKPTTRGVAPIVPMYSERHTAYVVICDNEVDEAWMRQRLKLPEQAASYSDSKIRAPRVLTVAQLRTVMQGGE